MQTFLPYPNFDRSVAALDNQRLGKQRVETLQIVLSLCGVNADLTPHRPGQRSWASHAVSKMWAGHLACLLTYQRATCNEWMRRGYRDTCLEKSYRAWASVGYPDSGSCPWWLGNSVLHFTHRANLVRKFPAHYLQQFPDFTLKGAQTVAYVWPQPDRTFRSGPPPPSSETGIQSDSHEI